MKRPRRIIRWTLVAAVGLAGLFALAMVGLAAFGLCDHLGESEVGLVLGNKVEADNTPSALLQARLDTALRLWRLGYFEWVIVSGGVDPQGHDEAAVMRDYLVAHGLPAEKILADNAGVNTYESARYTVRTMREHGWDGVCVVTQYYHVPRARMALRRFGARDISSGPARNFEWRDLVALAREVVACVWYSWRHYDHFPGNWHPPAPPPGVSTNSTPARRRA